MRTTSHPHLHLLAALASSFAALAGGLPAQARYDVTDLGSANGTWSSAFGINEAGEVVGGTVVTLADWRACTWTNGVMTVLPLPPNYATSAYGMAINAAGDVAGFDNASRAVLWSGGAAYLLPGFGGGYDGARAINDAGQVVGFSAVASGDWHAFLWEHGSLQDLGTLGGSYSSAYAINQAGQVAGDSAVVPNGQHPFFWDNGHMQNLPTLGGNLATAYAINDSGQMAGYSWLAGRYLRSHAFLRDATQMIDLGTLEGFNGSSTALDVNNLGQVVGESSYPGSGYNESHAFLYENGVLMDLNNLLPPGTGWVLKTASGINDAGQIVGSGIPPGSNQVERAFLLEPRSTDLALEGPAPGLAGVANTWRVRNCTPHGAVRVLYGIRAGAGRFPGCSGVTFGIDHPNTTGPILADGHGLATLIALVPSATAGLTVLFQACEPSTCRISSLVPHRFP